MIEHPFLFDSLIQQSKSKESVIQQTQMVFKQIDKVIRKTPYSWCGYDTFDKMMVSDN